MYNKDTLGEILTEYREQNGLGLREAAEKIGISYSYLGKIERQDVRPPKETVIKIAETLGLSVYRLLNSSGYVVDILKDVRTVDLNLTHVELLEVLEKHRIYATMYLRQEVYKVEPNYRKFCDKINFEYERFYDITTNERYTTLHEAATLCLFLNVNFSDVFQIKKVNYDVKFIGMQKEEDVALQCHMMIEKFKIKSREKKNESSDEIAVTAENDNSRKINFSTHAISQELINSDMKKYLLDINDDELYYLVRQLQLYRQLRLKIGK
jgi:transcriptional regulator with XRE-family HTH domain